MKNRVGGGGKGKKKYLYSNKLIKNFKVFCKLHCFQLFFDTQFSSFLNGYFIFDLFDETFIVECGQHVDKTVSLKLFRYHMILFHAFTQNFSCCITFLIQAFLPSKLERSNQVKYKGLGIKMELTVAQPDDWHLHLRDGDLLKAVIPHR